MPRTHVDVLDGPEEDCLLYLGQAEEKRLRLKSFATQLEEVARSGKIGGKKALVIGHEGEVGSGTLIKETTIEGEDGLSFVAAEGPAVKATMLPVQE